MTTQITSRVGGCPCTLLPRAGASAVYRTLSRVRRQLILVSDFCGNICGELKVLKLSGLLARACVRSAAESASRGSSVLPFVKFLLHDRSLLALYSRLFAASAHAPALQFPLPVDSTSRRGRGEGDVDDSSSRRRADHGTGPPPARYRPYVVESAPHHQRRVQADNHR